MKKSLLLLLTFWLGGLLSLSAQELPLLGKLRLPTSTFGMDTVGGSDVWGWTAPDGTEYAIMGTATGTAFVRASDLALLDEVPGPSGGDSYYHRDMVTYQDYCYVVNTMTGSGGGMQIIDLTYLPDSVHLVNTVVGTPSGWTQSHNMWIDTDLGYAYLVDHWYGGVRILDLVDPVNPVEVGFISAPQTHDMFARNDTVWLAEGWNYAYSVWDVSVKSSPVMITRITDPAFGYAHQIWPTDDGDHFITTEETEFKTVKIWDMTDPANVTLVGEYLGPANLAHNAHLEGDTMYLSHYESGVRVVDISDRTNPVEIAYYDTYPAGDTGLYRGCWGIYPHTQNGMIFASNMDGWLFVLGEDSSLITAVNPASVDEFENAVSLYPNPMTDHVTIGFEQQVAGEVAISVLDLAGKEIANLAKKFVPKGKAAFRWDVRNTTGMSLPMGTYFIKVTTNQGEKISRIVVE